MYVRKILALIFVTFMLCGCGSYLRKDLTLIDRAKLDAKAMTIWYTGAYYSIANMMADHSLSESQLKVLKKYVNPKMNKFKRILITYIDSVALAEASNAPALVMDESKLTGLMTSIINDLQELGLLGQLQEGPPEATVISNTADADLKKILLAMSDLPTSTKEVRHV